MPGRRDRSWRRRGQRPGEDPAPDPQDAWRAAVDGWIPTLEAQTTHLHRAFEGLADRVARLELHDELRTMTDWIEHASVHAAPLVSVVMATRNRSPFLDRAIDSLSAQRYPNWELVAVDDGSDDDTSERLRDHGDSRVRPLRIEAAGPGAARNAGLRAARGEILAYLDDDNRMHPLWLKAVVWAFEQRPDVDVVYGAVTIDDTARHHGEPGARLPSLWMHRFDRSAMVDANIADMGAIAHRAGMDVWFDERLRQAGDWDFLLSLVADKDPLVLPVVALHYLSDAPDRLSHGPTLRDDVARIQRKHSSKLGDR